MTREDLEKLDRDSLLDQAKQLGVTRPNILTRPELVDEILLRTIFDSEVRGESRGLFGRARDLLARLVEQGLNLPDAAERIRAVGRTFTRARGAAPLPTLTLAEIYAAQGYRERAVETLERVLSVEPDHAAAQALLAKLREAPQAATPRLPPEPEEETATEPRAPSSSTDDEGALLPVVDKAPPEPSQMLDLAPLPTHYDVDECVAIAVDPTTAYVYWEVRQRTLSHLQSAHPGGAIALRLVLVEATWAGPRSTVRDERVGVTLGELFAADVPPGCVVCAAIGYAEGSLFIPIAHSQAVELPPNGPSAADADALSRWSASGATPVAVTDEAIATFRRAVQARRDHATGKRAGAPALRTPPGLPQGSSDQAPQLPH